MNNSDILFLYDAKLSNPNGDADDENRPRMDYETSTNLVSDVRLKRYARDYLLDKGYDVFVSQVDGKPVTATQKIDSVFKKYEGKVDTKNLTNDEISWLLDQLIDVRLFGATMPIKSSEGKGSSLTFTGPVQFNWGYSLNPVTLVESNTITSRFSSEADKATTMGKDYRVYYSLIAFAGIVSGKRAEHTKMKEKDLELLEEALIKSIPLLATRSKIGQYPRLYVRVEYNSSDFLIGDLRDYIERLEDTAIRDISDYTLNLESLKIVLEKYLDRIDTITYWHHDQLQMKTSLGTGNFETIMGKNISSKLKKLPL